LHERKNCAMSNLIKKNHLRLEALKWTLN
jgi:hypothetical protein